MMKYGATFHSRIVLQSSNKEIVNSTVDILDFKWLISILSAVNNCR